MKRSWVFTILAVVAVWIAGGIWWLKDSAPIIRVIYFSGLLEGQLVKEEIPKFTAEHGIIVKFDEVPYDEVRRKEIASLRSAQGVYDVMFIDDVWLYEYARNKYLHPLDELIGRDGVDMDDFFPLVRKAGAELDGTTWLIPQRADVQVLFYRTDLFADKAYQQKFRQKYTSELRVPETWDEYRQVAEFFSGEGKTASPPFFGCAETLKPRNFAFEFFAMRYWAVSNKNFLDDQGRPVFDIPETVAAMKLLSNIRSFAAPGSANASNDETIMIFSNGKAALAPQWYAFYRTIRDPKTAVHDKFNVTLVPGVKAADGKIRRTPRIGGGSLGIPRNTAKKEAAWKFIKHMTSTEFMERGAVRGAMVTRQSAFQNPEVEKNNPDISTYLKSLKQCWFRPRTDRFMELESSVGLAVSQAFVGELTPEEALRLAVENTRSLGK